MPFQDIKVGQATQPWRLFLVVLTIIFLAEAVVMLILPQLLPAGASFVLEAVVDACMLTAMLAPMLWSLVIRPLQALLETRTRLLARLLTAQEEERGRIARDLHDGLGQSLTCLTVGLRAIEESSQDEQIREHVRELRRIGSATHEEIRRISSGLRPSILDDLGLAAALERYFDDVERINSIQTSLELDGLRQSRLPRSIETALYRIVQEATTNAIRHGAATDIRLSVRLSSQSIELEIQDNGRGFDPYTALRQRSGQKVSVGLSSIRERVALLSGGIRFDSRPGEGTRVVVRIPLNQNDDANEDASTPETHSPGLFDSGAGL